MYEILTANVPQVEPYSIDEMFLDLTGIADLEVLCRRLRDDVRRLAKIPTCVGIGPTKTIAKLANRIAKDDFALRGICVAFATTPCAPRTIPNHRSAWCGASAAKRLKN